LKILTIFCLILIAYNLFIPVVFGQVPPGATPTPPGGGGPGNQYSSTAPQTPGQLYNQLPTTTTTQYTPGQLYNQLPIATTTQSTTGGAPPGTKPQTSQEQVASANILALLAGKVMGAIVSFAAGILDFTIKLSDDVIKLNGVRSAWSFFLNITNLGFILALIVIAFATILHIESYAMKQTLWKLIVAALLVNFSLVITGAFIQLSNSISHMMLGSYLKDTKFLSNALARALEIQKVSFTGAPQESKGALAQLWDSVKGVVSLITDPVGFLMSLFASAIFVLIFTILIILIFLTLAIMFLVRFIYLAFLAMVSPIVWILWIFPYTKKHWTKWWSELIRWNIFGPAALLFVIASISIANGMNDAAAYRNINNSPAVYAADTTLLAGSSFLQHGIKIIIILGFLIGGMITANKFGIAGGGIAINAAKKMRGWSARKGKEWVGRAGQRTLGSERIKKMNEKLAGSRVPGSKLLAKGLNRMGSKAEKAAGAPLKSYEDYLQGLSRDRLETEILATSGRKRAKAIEFAAKNNKLKPDGAVASKFLNDPDKLEGLEKDFKNFGFDSDQLSKGAGFKNSKILKLAQDLEKLHSQAGQVFDPVEAAKIAKEYDRIREEIANEQAKILQKASPTDVAKNSAVMNLYKEHPVLEATIGPYAVGVLRQAFADALTQTNKLGAMNKMMPNMTSEDIKKFTYSIQKTVEKLQDSGQEDTAKRIIKALNKSKANAIFGEAIKEEKEEKEK
jgi:hypothetical protein